MALEKLSKSAQMVIKFDFSTCEKMPYRRFREWKMIAATWLAAFLKQKKQFHSTT